MKEEELKFKELQIIYIPDCCKYGYDSCTHCVKKQKPKKKNIAL